MKNFFFILALCCLGCIGAIAQSTTKVVTGAVIDKNGNPLPGAIVEATGGAGSPHLVKVSDRKICRNEIPKKESQRTEYDILVESRKNWQVVY